MPRQSKGDRTPIMLRLSPALLERVEGDAFSAGLDRHAWIVRAIERALDGWAGERQPSPAPTTPRGPTTVAAQKRKRAEPSAPAPRAAARRLVGFDAATGAPIYR